MADENTVVADSIQFKWVRILAPAGCCLNFMGITGNTHKYFALPVSMIKTAIERGAKVYELKIDEEKDEEENVISSTESEVALSLENYASDNGGKEVTAEDAKNAAPDIEKEVAETHAAEAEEKLVAIGLEIKAKQEAISGQGSIIGGGQDAIVPPGPDPEIPL